MGYEFPMGQMPLVDAVLGRIPGVTSVGKFGRAPIGVQTTPTDIWDRADADATQSIWLAPTGARTHEIVSTSGDDASGGLGAHTVRIYGLTSWDAAPEVEDVVMTGLTPKATAKQWVIIHRMRVLPGAHGTSGPNVGTITATTVGQTVDTVTAAIRPTVGQTGMAIFGVPSGCHAIMLLYYTSTLRTGGGATVLADLSIQVAEAPETFPSVFVEKHTDGVISSGTSALRHKFEIPRRYDGPCIIKLQASASVNDTDMSAGFDLLLIDK
jgi:hypothetical protein